MTNSRPTEYMISAFPLDHPDAARYAVWVQWRGEDTYRVNADRAGSGMVYTSSGDEVWDVDPDEADPQAPATRFDLDTALSIAHEAAERLAHNAHGRGHRPNPA